MPSYAIRADVIKEAIEGESLLSLVSNELMMVAHKNGQFSKVTFPLPCSSVLPPALVHHACEWKSAREWKKMIGKQFLDR
jgi:hypothetical protein